MLDSTKEGKEQKRKKVARLKGDAMKGSDFTILETGKMDIPRFDLTDKVAIITGVASDIGTAAVLRDVCSLWCELVIADMDAEGIELRAPRDRR